MKKLFIVLLGVLFIGLPVLAKEDALNTENGEVENIQVSNEKSNEKTKQPTSADLVRQHNKIERLEYSKKLKQRDLDYLQKRLEEKKQELEKFGSVEDKNQNETPKGEEK